MASDFFWKGTTQFIEKLQTPYGATRFVSGGTGPNRWLEITDPLGGKERYEYRDWCYGIDDSEPTAPAGITNSGLRYGNTFQWSKKAMAQIGSNPLDYHLARITRWLTQGTGTSAKTVAVAHSTKAPLENRVWRQYPGQPDANTIGSLGSPNRIVRLLDDGATQETTYTYNAAGRVTQAVDPVGRTFAYDYDVATGLDLLAIRQTRSGTNEVLASFSNYLNHQPQSITDAAGKITTIAYNSRGQPDTVTNANNEVTKFTYAGAGTNGYGKVQTITRAFGTALAATTQYTYDGFGRLQTVTNLDGYAVTRSYDALSGDPLKSLDRVTRITYPDTTYEEITWNRLDAEWRRDRLGRLTHVVYDEMQRVKDITDPLNRTTHYDWCACGAFDSLRDPAGNVTSWDRDLQYRILTKRIAGQVVFTYTYGPATGRLQTVTDALGQVTTYGYKADDRLESLTYTGEQLPTPDVTFAYDANYSRLTSVATTGLPAISYAYVPVNPADAVYGDGQLASVTGLWGDVATYTYDQLGRVQDSPTSSTRVYDTLGRLESYSNALGAFDPVYIGNTGRVDFITYPNGQKADFDYHPNSLDKRLKEIKNLGPTGNVISKFNYVYDATGQITEWTQFNPGMTAGERHVIGPDAADQLQTIDVRDENTNTLLQQFTYGYDLAGNRTSEQIDAAVTTWVPTPSTSSSPRAATAAHAASPTIRMAQRPTTARREPLNGTPPAGYTRSITPERQIARNSATTG